MTSQHDQQCTDMNTNWKMFWAAVRSMKPLEILHKGKNLWVEAGRWRRGECQQKDEHEPT